MMQEQARQQQQAEQLRQQQLKLQQEQQLRQQELLRQQQVAQQKSQQEAMQRQQQQQLKAAEQQRQQQEAVKQQQFQAQQAKQRNLQTASGNSNQGGAIDGLLRSGLGGLSLGSHDANANNTPAAISPQQSGSGVVSPSSNGFDATGSYLGALNDSFLHCPSNADSERERQYTPRNPYNVPSSYPTTPASIFENPAVFEKLGVDCLFFIFYYAQGTYQQYLAARELKKQSWRYHKKYMTWFQRHEEPKVTTDEFEQGTYVYFDYESGWCQRIKTDFRFEYSFLEDSVSI